MMKKWLHMAALAGVLTTLNTGCSNDETPSQTLAGTRWSYETKGNGQIRFDQKTFTYDYTYRANDRQSGLNAQGAYAEHGYQANEERHLQGSYVYRPPFVEFSVLNLDKGKSERLTAKIENGTLVFDNKTFRQTAP